MPQLRLALYQDGVQLWCAPTVDDRDEWQTTMRHIAYEGRLFVLSACQYLTRGNAPDAYDAIQGNDPDTVLIRGGSVIVSPLGVVLAGPLYGEEGILTADIDLGEIARGTYDLDVVGHYARPDVFDLRVDTTPRSAVTRRHRAIQRSMPFVIDLLTLAVEAGMDFMNALQRAVERRAMDPLTEELVHTIHEIQLGAPRREALRNLARRVNMPDMRSFSHALIQADELGVSIGAILRIQSDQMRQRRFDRAERLANEAPVKMLGPLMLFIFPAVFIVLLGPLLARVVGHAI